MRLRSHTYQHLERAAARTRGLARPHCPLFPSPISPSPISAPYFCRCLSPLPHFQAQRKSTIFEPYNERELGRQHVVAARRQDPELERMDDLKLISGCSYPQRAFDLVFVHGLDGDQDDTWQHPANAKGDSWPAWLAEQFPHVGVWSFGYQVAASAWKGDSMPLSDRAMNMLDQLQLDGLGQRPLGFVCHSLGGLLVKQALRSARDLGDNRFAPICESTRFILFLATPHHGSSLANWIKHLGTLLRTTVTIDELQQHHPRLRELNQWYRNNVHELKIDTYVYFENLKTNGVQVVDAASADPGIPGVSPIGVDFDHVTICKPSTRQERIYRRTEQILDHFLAVDQQNP